MKVVLIATGRLPRSYFTTVRSDLGDRPDLVLDVIGWAPPREPLEDSVSRFVLVGPGRMPVQAADGGTPAAAPAAPAAAPAAPAAVSEPARANAPAPAVRRPKPLPRRLVAGLRRRAGSAVRVVKKSSAWAKLRQLRTDEVSRELWSRIRSRDDLLRMVNEADIVIALDSRSIRAGWELARRPGAPKVVLGVQAATRELAAS